MSLTDLDVRCEPGRVRPGTMDANLSRRLDMACYADRIEIMMNNTNRRIFVSAMQNNEGVVLRLVHFVNECT